MASSQVRRDLLTHPDKTILYVPGKWPPASMPYDFSKAYENGTESYEIAMDWLEGLKIKELASTASPQTSRGSSRESTPHQRFRNPRVTSASARAMEVLIRFRGSKKLYGSPERVRAHIEDLTIRPASFAPPAKLDKQVDISITYRDGWPIYLVTPRTGTTTRRAIYTHGGAWIHEIVGFHWRFVAEVAVRANCEVTVPIYPLVPLGSAAQVVPVIADLAEELVTEVGASNVSLIGDSAGATITLSAAQLLCSRGIEGPRLILLSRAGPDIQESTNSPHQPDGPWLDVPGLRVAIEQWRGDLPIDDPLVSPFFGDVNGLGPIMIFTSTRDITNADAHAFVHKAKGTGCGRDVVRGERNDPRLPTAADSRSETSPHSHRRSRGELTQHLIDVAPTPGLAWLHAAHRWWPVSWKCRSA